MNSKLKLCLKVGWLTTSLVFLLVGTNDCALVDGQCFATGQSMFLFMFLLSFPASILCVVAALFFLGTESPNSLATFLILWLLLTYGGYLQWFVLVPAFFAKDKLTILDLHQNKVAPNEPEQIAPKKPAPEDRRPPVRRPKPFRPIRAFDRQGRTPLERALGPRL